MGRAKFSNAVKDVPLLSEILRKQGYATIGVTANGTISRRQNLNRGFDSFTSGRKGHYGN